MKSKLKLFEINNLFNQFNVRLPLDEKVNILHLHLYRLPYLFVQSHPYVDSLFLPNRHISQDAPVYTWEKKGSYNLLHCLRPWKQERSYGEKHNV